MSREAAALPPTRTHGEVSALPQRVFLFENHDEALAIWRQAGVAGRILVHIDPHHDMGWVGPREHVTFANYICPALQDGLVRAVYWVVPEQSWESTGNRQQILHQLRQILHAYAGSSSGYRFERQRARAQILGKPLEICSLSSLPDFVEPVLLDLDVDFLTLPRVAGNPSAEHTELPWCWPEDLVGRMSARKMPWEIATIPYSVEGGYTPLRWKYLGEELALRLNPAATEDPRLPAMARLRAGAEAAARGELDKAVGEYQTGAALWPDSAAPLLHLALLLRRSGQLDEARSLYRQALARDPTYRTSYNSEGLWHYWNGNYKAAEQEFRRTLDLDSCDATSLVGLAWLAMRRKHWTDAERLLRHTLERDPENLDAWRALGKSSARQRNYAQAITAYERSLQLALSGHLTRKEPPAIHSGRPYPVDAEHWPVFVRLGQLYEKQGQKAAARQRYRMALAGGHDGLALRWRLLWLRGESEGAEGRVAKVWHCAKQLAHECQKPFRRLGLAAARGYETLRAW